MDDLDAEIIRLLQADARQSNRELARTLGIAPSTCLERVRALTQRGVIRGYRAEIDPAALNREVQALVAVQVRPPARTVLDGFRDFAAGLPEVLSVYVLSGEDDFLLQVGVPDLAGLHAFLTGKLGARREVAGYRTSMIFEQVQDPAPVRLAAGKGVAQ